MSKPTHHLNEFDPPARRRLAPAILIGLGVLVAAALIAGVVVRSGRALVPSGEEAATPADAHSMTHAGESTPSSMERLGTAPTLAITHDPAAREIVLEVGPLDLPAQASHHEVAQPPARIGTVPVAGWIHGFRVELVDAEGRAVPQSVLHHVNVISPDERELFSQIMLRVAAAGQETGPVAMPRLFGYRVREGQRLMVTAAFHNPTPQAYHGTRLRVRMRYTPANAWLKPVSIYPLYMDVMPPASVHAYDLLPGRSEKSWEASPAVAGRILGLSGHLHKYGVALRLEDVTTGELLWEAAPILDDAGEVVGMPVARFFRTLGVRVYPDHVYRLTAIYENPTGETIPDGAMGALGGVFIPAPGARWPAADPEHPEYRLDVEIVTSPYYGHGGGHGTHGTHDADAHGAGHDAARGAQDAHRTHGGVPGANGSGH